MMVVFFMAAEKALEEGIEPRLMVLHSDTRIENPVIHKLARSEMDKIRAHAMKLGIEMRVEIASPTLLDSWGPRILGGRAIPSFPMTNGDCSNDWKIKTMQTLRKRLLPVWGNGSECITLTGSREDGECRPWLENATAGRISLRAVSQQARGVVLLSPSRVEH